jgi:vacuolar-type H+-ATPase subunit H
MKRLWTASLIAGALVVSALPSASAAVTPGTKCSKAGIKEVYKGKTFTCIKSGQKLVWNNGVKVEPYDAAFAAEILAKAQTKADQILADAELSALQISTPPNCSKALVSIGSDPSTGVIALIYENPTPCDLVVRASAEFYCPRGKAGNNTVISRGTFTLKAKTKLFVSLNPQRYFPLVTLECAQLTGFTSNTISVANELTRRTEPKVTIESSKYSGTFNQANATKKASEILKSAKSRASKIIADAKNPVLIAKAWNALLEKNSVVKVAADRAAIEKAAADKAASIICVPNSNCPVGSTGPGGGIVFYDAGSQQAWGRYLEVAPAGWSGKSSDPIYAWSSKRPMVLSDGTIYDTECFVTFCETVPGVENSIEVNIDNSGIGLGYKNSNAILEQGNFPNVAAGIARAYSGGSQTDWFLPSTAELNLLCQWARNISLNTKIPCKGGILNSGTGGNGGFNSTSGYWSSSERNSIHSWMQGFNTGSHFWAFKGEKRAIRPIRAFPFDKAAADKAVADAARGILPGDGKVCNPNSNCPVGSTGPGGGIVFYDSGGRQSWGRYLEVAPAGWSGSATDPYNTWCNITNVHFASSITDLDLKAKIGVEIGKGKANTNLMLANCNSGAGHAAQTYKGGGKSDWFLPSRDELNELCKYAKLLPTSTGTDCPTKPECQLFSVLCQSPATLREGFGTVFPYSYWSSSETNDKSAWSQKFATEGVYKSQSVPKPDEPKAYVNRVRPVRAF